MVRKNLNWHDNTYNNSRVWLWAKPLSKERSQASDELSKLFSKLWHVIILNCSLKVRTSSTILSLRGRQRTTGVQGDKVWQAKSDNTDTPPKKYPFTLKKNQLLFQNTSTSRNVASNRQNYVSFLLDLTTKCGQISYWKLSQQIQSWFWSNVW